MVFDRNKTVESSQCDICASEVPDGEATCPVCGARQDTEEHHVPEQITWAVIRVVNTAIEAELMAGRLRSHGIPAIVLSQVDSTRNFTVGELAIAKVFVPSFHAVEAENILSQDADDPDWEDDVWKDDGADPE